MVYQGPVRPGDDEQKFRDTGKTVPAPPVYQGPVQKGFDEQKFRSSGRSVPSITPQKTTPQIPVYSSDLLKQSFTSQEALKQAEQQYRQQQEKLRLEGIEQTRLRSQSVLRGETKTPIEKIKQQFTELRGAIQDRTRDIFSRVQTRVQETFKPKEEKAVQEGKLFLTPKEAGVEEAEEGSVFFIDAKDVQAKPYIPVITPASIFFSGKVSDFKETKVGKGVSFLVNPFGKEVRVIGGRIIPTEEFKEVSPAMQKLIFASQPESILLSTRFPKIQDVGVKFYGVKTGTEEGLQKTYLKFKTTAGERGGAVGVSDNLGTTKDGLLFGQTDVIGYKGKGIFDLTTEKAVKDLAKGDITMTLKDIKRFGAREGTLTLFKDDKFYQISAGNAGQVGDKNLFQFVGADFGTIREGTLNIFGRTIMEGQRGDIYSFGQIADLSQTGKINFLSSGGTIDLLASKTASISATQSAVRSAVGGLRAIPSGSVAPAIIPFFALEDSITQTKITEQQPVITPPQQDIKEISILKTDVKEKPIQSGVFKNGSKVKQKEISLLSTGLKTDLRTTPEQDTKFKQDNITKQRNIFGLGVKQRQAQAQPQQFKQPLLTKLIRKTKQQAPFSPFVFSVGTKKPKVIKKKGEGEWEVFVKKFGQDTSVGQFGTLEEAKAKLFKKLRTTLRASGFVTQDGEKVKIPTGWSEFVPSKKDSFRIVEPRRFRLGTPSEVSEIQFFKKSGSRKKRKRGFDWF
jgi:hypothetical protein